MTGTDGNEGQGQRQRTSRPIHPSPARGTRPSPDSFVSTLLVLATFFLVASAAWAQQAISGLDPVFPDGEGRQLVLDRCTACHSAERLRQVVAAESSREKWNEVVQRMIRNFNAPIPAGEVNPIVDYLARHGGQLSLVEAGETQQADAQAELSSFLPDTQGKALLQLYCTGCHHATSIRKIIAQRAGADREYWDALVRRMITVWNAPIDAEQEAAILVEYLQKHFGPSWGQAH